MSIRVVNLNMQYLYGSEAIKNLSFECKDGERLAILAASEGGKTSLLKCIAGLYPSTQGEIFIDEIPVTCLKPKKRNVLMIYEDGGIIKSKSVRFHLEYPLKIRKIDKLERKRRIIEVSKRFDLYPILTDITRMLYPDDIIRLSFARAAVRETGVCLIDDPFKKLNGGAREELFQEMLPHILALKGSVVFATTSADEAFSVADRVIVLNFGNNEQTGTADELINSPASIVVDKFANPHNARVACTVQSNGEDVYIELLGKRLILNAEYLGKEVTASFAVQEDASGEVAYPTSYGYLGGRQYVQFASGATLFINQPQKTEYKLAPLGNVHIFDNSSEKRLTSII